MIRLQIIPKSKTSKFALSYVFDGSVTLSGLIYRFNRLNSISHAKPLTKSSSYSRLWIDRPLASWDINGYACIIRRLIR